MPAANVHAVRLCLLLIMVPACAREPQSNATLSPDTFARQWLEAWNSHHVDRIVDYYTNDAVYEDVPNVENGWVEPWRGQQVIRKALVKMFEDMPDLGFEFLYASRAGDGMVVEWIMTGSRWRDSTGKFAIRGVSVLRFNGDKIASARDYYDMYLMLSKLGMVPAPVVGQHQTSGDSVSR
jgi:steroid delta-isomerase-like uncharacterized protein